MTHERCWICAFHNGERCTQTFRLIFHVEPVGGQVEFVTTPGMVPEELKDDLNRYFKKLIDRIIPVIEVMPIWDHIREFQLANKDREDCPARKISKEKECYLRIVT